MRIRCAKIIFVLVILAFISRAFAGTLTVNLPDTITAKSAVALAPPTTAGQEGSPLPGLIHGQVITFGNLQPATPYDLKITLDSGIILRGVNLSWYTREPAKADAAPLNDDDLKQIAAIVGDVKSFYNISRIITQSGDHNRATVLVERIRSNDFHSDAGGEVIWRIELWYFTNDFGGWSEITQSNKVLLRERFPTNAEYRAEAKPLRWIPILGGIMLNKNGAAQKLDVPTNAVAPATRPVE